MLGGLELFFFLAKGVSSLQYAFAAMSMLYRSTAVGF